MEVLLMYWQIMIDYFVRMPDFLSKMDFSCPTPSTVNF